MRDILMGACTSRTRSEGDADTKGKRIREGNIRTISGSFHFHDLNKDGVIDREDLKQYFKSDTSVAAIIERLDKNKDGVISYAEFYSEVSKIKDGEATLQTYLEKFPLLTDAVKESADKPKKMLQLQGVEVPMTWAPHIPVDVIDKVVLAGPFKDWMASMNRIQNEDMSKPELIVDKVHIQHVDMFGPKVGFIKFEVASRKWNEKMQQVAFVPGIVFMRGGAVGILCILIEAETEKQYALITLQPRIPAGYSEFAEIPAGMLDGEPNKQKFAGKAAKEMNEETLLEIKETELYDLTFMAYGDKYQGMYPSAGGCDEFLKLYLYRRYMGQETMQMLRMAHGGDGASEIIKLKLVPLEDLWREAPDAKALSALYLYEKFKELNIDHPPTPRNHEQESQLVAMLSPKVEGKLTHAHENLGAGEPSTSKSELQTSKSFLLKK